MPLTKPIDFGTLRSEIDMRVERAASVLLRCMSPLVMWWTVPAPSNEVP